MLVVTFVKLQVFHNYFYPRAVIYPTTSCRYKIIQEKWLQIDIKIKKYKTFSVLIYSYINTSGNWKNEKLCGNTTPAGRSVFTQFRVFPIFTNSCEINL